MYAKNRFILHKDKLKRRRRDKGVGPNHSPRHAGKSRLMEMNDSEIEEVNTRLACANAASFVVRTAVRDFPRLMQRGAETTKERLDLKEFIVQKSINDLLFMKQVISVVEKEEEEEE